MPYKKQQIIWNIGKLALGIYIPHKKLMSQIKWTAYIYIAMVFFMVCLTIGISTMFPSISKLSNNVLDLYLHKYETIINDKNITQNELFHTAMIFIFIKCFIASLIILLFVYLCKIRCAICAYLNTGKTKLLIDILLNPCPIISYRFFKENKYDDPVIFDFWKIINFSINPKKDFPEICSSSPILTTKNLSFMYHSEKKTWDVLWHKILKTISPSLYKRHLVNKNALHNGKDVHSIQELKIIRNFNLSINAGKLTTILGCNGSSKTAFLKLILRLLEKYEGQITWVTTEAKMIKLKNFYKNISYVAQDSLLQDEITVYDYVACGLFPSFRFFKFNYPKNNEAVLNNLRMMELIDHKDKKLKDLSGGEKQKALLALVFTQNTPVIVLDEPTSYLDINAQYKILKTLKDLQIKENKTIIMVLHDIKQAEQFSDEIILLKKGEVYGYGETKKMLTRENIENVFEVPWD